MKGLPYPSQKEFKPLCTTGFTPSSQDTFDSGNYGIADEWIEWYTLTPEERWEQSGRLWETYLLLGGSLDPEPDTESPFFDAETWRPLPAHGRSSLRVLRSSGI